MVQSNKFHGLPMEDPLDHLDEFDRLCSLTKINGVSEDGFKLRLFPFSLGDKAHLWEKNLPHSSITSWDDCKKAFLAKFFSNARTARLRNEISGFIQKNGETFSEAWERFKGYTLRCPHHGFSNESLLSTLYRGVLPRIRMLLDTASNGNFLNKDVDDGWELVENLAQSDGNYTEDYDRSIRGSVDSDERTRKEIKSLNEKFDKFILSQQRHVHFANEEEVFHVQDGEADQIEEVSYVQNHGGYNKGFTNYKNNPNLSYRSTNVENPQDQVYPAPPPQQNKPFVPYNQTQGFVPKQNFQGRYNPQGAIGQPPGFAPQQAPTPTAHDQDLRSMMQQLLQGQAASTMETAKKFAEAKNHMDYTFATLNNKFETLNSKIKYMENTSASTSSTMHPGQLPGKAIQNPKDFAHVKAITLRSGKELPATGGTTPITVDSENQDGEILCQGEQQAEQTNMNSSDQLDTTTRPASRVQPSPVEKIAPAKEKKAPFIPPPYKPKLPFPGRFYKDRVERYRAIFDKHIKDIEVKMPILDALALLPQSHNWIKDAIMERLKEVRGMVVQSYECSAITHKEVVQEKIDDPGSFTLPCSLGPLTFNNCLCDLGASISLMPLSVAKRLGFSKYKPCKVSLVLADGSTRLPQGVLEDLPIKIGNVKVPTDFVVLEMDEEPTDPLILGRPFLATAGAVIDVKQGMIDLHLGKGLKMKFDIKDPTKKPTIEGQTFHNEELVKLADKPLGELTEQEAYIEEKSIENQAADWARDGAKFDDLITEEEEISLDLQLQLDDFAKCTKAPPDKYHNVSTVMALTEAMIELTDQVKRMSVQIKELQAKVADPSSRKDKQVLNDFGMSRAFANATRASSFCNLPQKIPKGISVPPLNPP